MARKSMGVSAVSRMLAVLDSFGVDAPFLTLSEIAGRAGLPLSSTHGIVSELVDQGLLERVANRRYRVGTRLWEIGSRTPGVLGLREFALPHLQSVQSVVRQHTQLVVRSELDVLVIERLSDRDAVVNASVIGGRIPLQHSSGGLVLLADADEALIEGVLERGLNPATDAGIRSEKELRETLARVRRYGFAAADGFIFVESRGIAVPVRGAHGVVVGALGVVVANDGSPPFPHVTLLRRAAARISEALMRSTLPAGDPRARPGGAYRRMVNSSERSMEYLGTHEPEP
ncbi:IclR family transcriptional regulator [Okibacterium endophyticum]